MGAEAGLGLDQEPDIVPNFSQIERCERAEGVGDTIQCNGHHAQHYRVLRFDSSRPQSATTGGPAP